jgi:hypothetical protein
MKFDIDIKPGPDLLPFCFCFHVRKILMQTYGNLSLALSPSPYHSGASEANSSSIGQCWPIGYLFLRWGPDLSVSATYRRFLSPLPFPDPRPPLPLATFP